MVWVFLKGQYFRMGDIDNPAVLAEPQALLCLQNAEDIVQAPSGRNQVAKAISIEPGYSIVATNPSLGVMRIDASDLANLDAVLGG